MGIRVAQSPPSNPYTPEYKVDVLGFWSECSYPYHGGVVLMRKIERQKGREYPDGLEC